MEKARDVWASVPETALARRVTELERLNDSLIRENVARQSDIAKLAEALKLMATGMEMLTTAIAVAGGGKAPKQ